jgi:integrase
MSQHAATKLKARTIDSYKALLRSHIRPALGDIRMTDIRRAHVSKLHHSLSDTPGAANRAIAACSSIWNWTAVERDDLTLPPNPCKGIKRNPEEGRERFLSAEELACLGDALAEAETIGLPYDVDETKPKAKHAPKPENRRRKVDPFAIAAMRLLILTGARLNEILTAQWSFVDFELVKSADLEDRQEERLPVRRRVGDPGRPAPHRGKLAYHPRRKGRAAPGGLEETVAGCDPGCRTRGAAASRSPA